ncbi:MAG: tail fiber domain-containing protein, partial [Anaerolineales bacterium]|nr:tail fiber domain-containing protein [Anaerolineales bacterium]
DISGDADIDGTLETDNLTVGGSQGSDGEVLTSTGTGVAWEEAGGADEMSWNDGTATRISGSSTSTGSFGHGYYAGNVGIGTTSPTSGEGWSKFLHISDTDPALILTPTGSTLGGSIGAGGAGLYMSAYGHATATNNVIIFRTEETNSQSSPTERMRITSDGIVGIGTTTPGQNLAGSTGDRTDASLLHIKNGSGHARFILEGNTGASMELVDVTGGSDLKIMQIAVSDDVTSFHSVDDDLAAYKSQNILVLDHDSGNVGIGTASPDGPLHVHASTAGSVTANTNFNDLVLETSAHTGMTIFSGTDSHGAIYFGDSGGNNRGQIKYLHPQDAMTFATADSEAMTIDSNGWFYLYSNGVEPGAGQGGWSYQNADVNSPPVVTHRIRHSRGSGVDSTSMHLFYNGNGAVGSIATAGSGTSFNTTSDYRQKENEVSISDGLERLNQLKPYRFNFKADPNETLDGFFAHEAQEIVPQAVTGEKDDTETVINVVVNESDMVLVAGVTEEQWIIGKSEEKYPSNSTWESSKVVPDYQKIDHSGLVPLLIAAVQELSAKVEALENE